MSAGNCRNDIGAVITSSGQHYMQLFLVKRSLLYDERPALSSTAVGGEVMAGLVSEA